jgi:DNA invertase Pin-like site-specific DNA recombinase
MTIIGYARVSTTDQDLSIQLGALKSAGADIVRSEKHPGRRPKAAASCKPCWTF